MLGQGAALVELRKAHRYATTDGRLTIPQIGRAQKQTLTPLADPRQHVCTVQGHQHAVAAGQRQAVAMQALKNFRSSSQHAGVFRRRPRNPRACLAIEFVSAGLGFFKIQIAAVNGTTTNHALHAFVFHRTQLVNVVHVGQAA
jgi:hypothetical protein